MTRARRGPPERDVAYWLGPQVDRWVRGDVTWADRGGWVRAELAVGTSAGVRLRLVVQVGRVRPWSPTVVLLDAVTEACLRRLDVRAGHANTRTDQRRWEPGTHLHVWRDSCGDAHAVDLPGQTWDDADISAPPGELEEVVRVFCARLGIDVTGMAWSDPPRSMGTGHAERGAR